MIQVNQFRISAFFACLLLSVQAIWGQVGSLDVSAPANIAASYAYVSLPNGGWGTPATNLCGDLVLAEDSLGLSLACTPIVNDVAGKIVVIDRGTCAFVLKALAAQEAGAAGVIVANSTAAVPAAMADNGLGYLVGIPVAMISNADGAIIKAELAAGNTVTACMKLPDVDVSFTVDMREETVSPFGVFMAYIVEGAASATGTPMTPNGDGTYSATVSVPATSDVYYLFVNGITAADAELVPADCGLQDATGLYIRGVWSSTTGGEVDKVCFGKCTYCKSAVTFTVDMKQEVVSAAGVHIAGSFQGWDPAATPMTDMGNGVWQVTVDINPLDSIQYKFINGDAWGSDETTITADCGVDNGVGGFNRVFAVPNADSSATDPVCFGKCTLCKASVTFSVDMSLETVSPDGVHIAGNFQGWDPAATAMTDAGNGVWTYTADFDPGEELQYKFINGNAWGSDETGITADCGVDNGVGGFNRVFTVPNGGSADIPTVCYNSCSACPTFDCDPGAIICDGFEDYTLGGLNAQAAWWDVWDGTGGDGIVTDEQAASGSKSMKIDFTLPGATQDVILVLGDSTSGRYGLKWKMYIPAGKNAYFNTQHDITVGAHVFGVEVYFEANGAGRVVRGSTNVGTFTFPYDTWFTLENDIDIDNDIQWMSVNGGAPVIWKFSLTTGTGTSNKLAGIDYYPIDATYKYYVDEVQFVQRGPGIAQDFCLNARDIQALFGQAPGTTQSSGLFDNTGANIAGDPAAGWDCFGEPDGLGAAPELNNSQWYTFKGDGSTYFIETDDCGSTNYINDGDSQFALYSGPNCASLTPVACNEDGPNAVQGDYKAGLEIATVNNRVYWLLVDGFSFNGALSDGEYCIQVTRRPPPLRAVTFRVDMSQEVVAPDGAFIAGEFNNWTGQAMTNAGNGIWTFTANLSEGDNVEYKFQNGSGGWEANLPPPCGLSGFGNRFVVVPNTATTLPIVCFESCGPCLSSYDEVAFANGVNIFPNPTTGLATVKFDLPESADLTVRVSNSLGQQLLMLTENRVQSGTRLLDLGKFGTGVYFVEFADGTHRATRRIVVE